MRVLSFLQPWASLVVIGAKKIETRSWDTVHRGPLLIHASLGKAYKKLEAEDPLYRFYHPLFATGKIPPVDQLPFGYIIGQVNLDATFKMADNIGAMVMDRKISDQELAFGHYAPGRFGWRLSKPVLFDTPIPAKGMLSLWEYMGPLPSPSKSSK